MNKYIALCRLSKEPETRYGGANNTAVARFSIAVQRRFKKDGEPDVDFFNCVAFGKQAEFVEKYLHKGTRVVIEGELRNNNYKNKDGQMVYNTEINVSSIEFAESKGTSTEVQQQSQVADPEWMTIPDGEPLPFV